MPPVFRHALFAIILANVFIWIHSAIVIGAFLAFVINDYKGVWKSWVQRTHYKLAIIIITIIIIIIIIIISSSSIIIVTSIILLLLLLLLLLLTFQN